MNELSMAQQEMRDRNAALPRRQTRYNACFLPFEEARDVVRAQGFKNVIKFQTWDQPANIPSSPDATYKDKGWINWGDFLGNDNISSGLANFLPYAEARDIVQAQKFKNVREFRKNKRPSEIPSHPHKVYQGKGWVNWGEFLGNGNVKHGIP
jgi:Phage-integrase repeat unit